MSLFPPDIIAAAQVAHKAYYPRGPFVSVILAQWAIESAYGKAESGKNNYFGIKATEAQIAAGQFTSVGTHETLRGRYIAEPQDFANYPTLADGFDAHSALLCTPHYKDCQAATTPEAYCMALQKDGYATGIPGHPYGLSLVAIIHANNLEQYDKEMIMSSTPTPTVASTAPSSTAASSATAAATSAPAAPATQNATQLTLAYGQAAQQALVALDGGIDLVFATIYAKYVPAFVAVFVPSSTLTSVIDAEFASWEKDVSGDALTINTQSVIIKNILLALMTAFPALEQALSGLPAALVAELKTLGVLH